MLARASCHTLHAAGAPVQQKGPPSYQLLQQVPNPVPRPGRTATAAPSGLPRNPVSTPRPASLSDGVLGRGREELPSPTVEMQCSQGRGGLSGTPQRGGLWEKSSMAASLSDSRAPAGVHGKVQGAVWATLSEVGCCLSHPLPLPLSVGGTGRRGGGRPPSLGPQPQHTGFLSMSVGMATGTDTRSRVRGPGDSLFWVMAGTPGLRRPGLLQAGLCPPLFTHDQPFPPWPPPLSSLGARSSWRDSPWDFRTDGLKR